jgi:hypothetical protein
VKPCLEIQPLLSLRAVHALDAEEQRRVEAHLASCASCRAEAAADEEALSLARLPPVSEGERHALRDLAAETLDELQRRDTGRFGRKRLAAALAAAAALVIAVLAPAVLRRTPTIPPAPQQVAEWEQPDLDTLWSDAGLVDVDGSVYAVASADVSDAALAAMDVTEGE